MTPAARVAAAIDILDEMARDKLAAEQVLTRWARRSRFAGSKDRAAVRDHVFDVLRRKRSAAHFGKGETGRALMIGLLREQGVALDSLFTGEGHAPALLTPEEAESPNRPPDKGACWNLPDWLIPAFEASLAERAETTALALQDRAPVFLRANTARTTRDAAQALLAAEGIACAPNLLCDTALTLTDGARGIRQSRAYVEGLVELQDAASQAVVADLPTGGKALDFCAGGGGKTLALAVDRARRVFAHDANPARMGDLPDRAARAGVDVTILSPSALEREAPYDLVLCDAPCSGSGAWRRAAEGKWALTPGRLAELNALQDTILAEAAPLVAPQGVLAYATCSVLRSENEDRVERFLGQMPGWTCRSQRRFDVGPDGDGFFVAHLKRDQ